MKRFSILAFIFISFSFLLNAESLVVRILDPGYEAYEALLSKGVDIALYHQGKFLDLVISDTELASYRDKYPDLIITQRETEIKANLRSGGRDIPGYRTYDEMLAEINQLAAIYPSLLQVQSIGSGWAKLYAQQGIEAYEDYANDIWALKLSDNVEQEEDEPQYLFVGAHHAREPISVEMCMGIVYHLLENYGSDPRVTAIMDNSEIWVVPLLNPDGHKIVLDQTEVMWRKNLNDNNGNQQIDLSSNGNGNDGADINRNYSHMWGNVSSTDNPYDSVYHGAYPFSEPESVALREFVLSKHFVASISYHSYGRYVLYPFGYAHNLSGPDAEEQGLLAQQMAQLTGYTGMPSYQLYPVSGSCEDWMYGVAGSFAYTVEMANQFIPSADQAALLVQEQIPAVLAFLERVNYKCVTGHVTDAISGEALQAHIYLAGMDNHVPARAPVYSRADFGSYHRFLPVGTYDFIVSAPGYIPQTGRVRVTATGVAVKDFALQPAEMIEASFLIRDVYGNALGGTLLELNEQQYVADSQGMVEPGFLQQGFYRLKASLPGYSGYYEQTTLMPGLNVITMSAEADIAEGFEQGAESWELTGNWGIGDSNAAVGDHWLGDNPQGQFWASTSYARYLSPLDTSGAQNISLNFHAKAAMTNYSEYAALQYQELGDVYWHTLLIFMGDSPWQYYEQDLSFLKGKTILLRFYKNNQFASNGNGFFLDELQVFKSGSYVSNEDLLPPPAKISCAPNPFSTSIDISAQNLPKGLISMDIFNLRGQKVMRKETNHLTNDAFSLKWDGKDFRGRDLPAGLYFIRLTKNSNTLIQRKILKLN